MIWFAATGDTAPIATRTTNWPATRENDEKRFAKQCRFDIAISTLKIGCQWCRPFNNVSIITRRNERNEYLTKQAEPNGVLYSFAPAYARTSFTDSPQPTIAIFAKSRTTGTCGHSPARFQIRSFPSHILRFSVNCFVRSFSRLPVLAEFPCRLENAR